MDTRDGFYPEFWQGMKNTTLLDMLAMLKEEYLRAAPNPAGLQSFFDKSLARMLDLKIGPPKTSGQSSRPR